jgi:hypothetical protein
MNFLSSHSWPKRHVAEEQTQLKQKPCVVSRLVPNVGTAVEELENLVPILPVDL